MFLFNGSCTHAIFSVSAPSPLRNIGEICYWGIFKCSFKRFCIAMQCWLSLLIMIGQEQDDRSVCVLRWITGLLTYIVSSGYWQCKQIAPHCIAANQICPLGQGRRRLKMLIMLLYPPCLFFWRSKKPGPRTVIVWLLTRSLDLIWLLPPFRAPSWRITPNRMMLCRIPLDLTEKVTDGIKAGLGDK